MERNGFTMVELTVVVFILTTAILGIAASATHMIQAASGVRVESEALQAVDGRISQIVMDPRYEDLESLYGITENELPGLDDFERVTQITHVETEGSGNHITDYKVVMVSVSGPGLAEGISRTIIVGSP